MTLPLLIYCLLAFGAYALALIILAGQAFAWNEDRRTFYLGGRNIALWPSIATFVATWMSAASLLGYTVWLHQEGYAAFTGSVNGWMLGLLPLPFAVARLRRSRALSLPEWLSDRFGDERLRTVSALSLLLAYTIYLVIQFRVFGAIVAHMLDINYLMASLLVYLFVIYTTFGGLPSVIRSDALNLFIMVAAVTLAAAAIIHQAGSPLEIHRRISILAPQMLHPFSSDGFLLSLSMMLAWGMGVAANPQYAIRIVSARSRRTALSMLAISPFIIGWIYLCITLVGLGGKVLSPAPLTGGQEMAFSRLVTAILPPLPSTLLLVAVLAAAVSTANSQLLLAACSFCYDLRTRGHRRVEDPPQEDTFLFRNRLAVAVIASVGLLLSHLPLPGILLLGRYSWTVVAICFFLPLYAPFFDDRRGLFAAMTSALALHHLLVFAFRLLPELAMLPALLMEALLWWFLSEARR